MANGRQRLHRELIHGILSTASTLGRDGARIGEGRELHVVVLVARRRLGGDEGWPSRLDGGDRGNDDDLRGASQVKDLLDVLAGLVKILKSYQTIDSKNLRAPGLVMLENVRYLSFWAHEYLLNATSLH